MDYFSVDYLIVYAFLLITLVIGLRAGRGIKDMREYALANRSFGTAALVLTFLATDIAGVSVVNGTARIFSEGIIYVVAHAGLIVNFSLMAFVVAPRMAYFRKCMTLGDIMKSLYGTCSGVLAGMLSFCIIVSLLGMEFFILGIIFETVLGIKSSWGIILGIVVLSVYTAHGGIKSVTITDVFQFIVLIVGIPLIAYITVDAAGGMQTIFTQVPTDRLQIFGHQKFLYYLILFIIWSFLPLGVSSPIVVQRMLMAQNTAQLRSQFLVIGIFLPLFRWVLLFIGLGALVLYPSIEPKNVVAHVINELLPEGAKGIAMAALIGISMSSLDSLLHTAGLTIVHDVIRPICNLKKVAINELLWVKWATVLVSSIVVIIGIHANDSFKLLLMALTFQAPTILFPVLAGIMGLQVDKRDFYTAFLGTLAAFIATKLYLPAHYDHFAILILIAVNAMIFFGMHLVRHKGFVVVERHQSTSELWQPAALSLMTHMKMLLPTPQNIIAYSQDKVQKYGAPYTLFGVFITIAYTLPYFLWSYVPLDHRSIMLIIRLIGGVSCSLLIVKEKWPKSLLPYLPTYWHLTLLYCLPFTSTVMFLLTQGSVEWLINVALTIMFLIVLVDWMSFIMLTVLGVSLGLLFYTLAIGPIDLHLDFSTGYLLVYTCFFFTLVALLFARRKEQFFEARLRAIGEEHGTVRQAGAFPHPATQRLANVIDRQVHEFLAIHNQQPICDIAARHADAWSMAPDFLHYFFPTALEVIKQGTHMRKHLTEVIATVYLAPKLALHSLKACLEAIVTTYTARYEQEIATDLSADYLIHTSSHHLQYAIVHVLQFLHAHHLEAQVRLWIARKEGIHIRLPGQAVSASLVQELLSLFPLKETASNMGLVISRLLIEAHGGHLLCKTCSIPGRAYTEFVVVIPPAGEEAEVNAEPT
jgi:Na+/proline symporter